MLEDLGSKAVIVTGAGSGIGRAIAMMLGQAGASVVVADVNSRGGEETAGMVNDSTSGRACFIRSDVSKAEDAQAMVERCVSEYGKLDAAVNNAGRVQAWKALHELSVEEWDLCHSVNLRGVFLCMQAQVRQMLRDGGGSIVVMSSNAAILGLPRSAEYCSSKAGVLGLVRSAAIEYATSNIRVNGILPGGTLTPMMSAALADDPGIQKIVDLFPMKRLARVEEIAAGAAFLLSDASSYVTGVSWSIDGGFGAV